MWTLVEEAAAYLADGGRDVVRKNLRAQGLPMHLHDDIVQEVLIDVLRAADRGVEPDNVPGYVSTLVHHTTVDVLRGNLRRSEGLVVGIVVQDDDELDRQGIDTVPDGDVLPDDQVITADELARLGPLVDDIRRSVMAHLRRAPYGAAGALAVLAIAHGDAEPADDCPAPTGGVAPSEAVTWAGVFYGGAERCFPTGGDPEDAAMRKRRSRALQRIRLLLQDAAADLSAILEDDDD